MKQVLIVHPFGIGDALFVTPVIRALHEAGIGAVDLILGSRTRALFETNPNVRDIFVADRGYMKSQPAWENMREIATLIRQLRRRRYDVLFDLSFSPQYSFVALTLLQIPARVGFSYKRRGIFLSHKMKLNGGFSGKHVAEHYLDLLAYVGIPRVSKGLELFFSDQDMAESKRLLCSLGLDGGKPYLVVAPGGGESWGKDARLKQWPAEHFSRLVQLIEQTKAAGALQAVLVAGGPKDKLLGESLRSMSGGRIVNLCGGTSLRVSALLLKSARLLLANDGGLVHLAAAVGTPTIAMYGPVDPVVYGPWPPSGLRAAITHDDLACRPCYQNMRYNGACEHVNCLNQLMPETVFKILSERGFFEKVRQDGKD